MGIYNILRLSIHPHSSSLGWMGEISSPFILLTHSSDKYVLVSAVNSLDLLSFRQWLASLQIMYNYFPTNKRLFVKCFNLDCGHEKFQPKFSFDVQQKFKFLTHLWYQRLFVWGVCWVRVPGVGMNCSTEIPEVMCCESAIVEIYFIKTSDDSFVFRLNVAS